MPFPFDISLIIDSLPLLGIGAMVTIEITAVAVALGTLIGLFVGIAELSRYWYFRIPSKIYVDFIRGTPLLVQIFIIYFALPIILGVRVEPFVAAVAACSINSGAYVAEIFRAGIQSIDKGQMEAGRSLGLSSGQTMKLIIMPQAFKNVLPALINEMIVLLKETAIIGYIGTIDITKAATLVQSRTYSAFVPLISAAIFYLVLVMLLTYFMGKVERRLRRSDH